jgi:hypothetical protein
MSLLKRLLFRQLKAQKGRHQNYKHHSFLLTDFTENTQDLSIQKYHALVWLSEFDQ